jgi:hypothetical protein
MDDSESEISEFDDNNGLPYNADIDLSDVESESCEAQCRICLESDNIRNLIAPCTCSGTSKWVHRTCLDRWRSTESNGRRFTHCHECNFEYGLRRKPETEENRKRKIKYYSLIGIDILVLILQIVILIIVIGIILCLIDRKRYIASMFGLDKGRPIWSYGATAIVFLFIWISCTMLLIYWSASMSGISFQEFCLPEVVFLLLCNMSFSKNAIGRLVMSIVIILAFCGFLCMGGYLQKKITQIMDERREQVGVVPEHEVYVVVDYADHDL